MAFVPVQPKHLLCKVPCCTANYSNCSNLRRHVRADHMQRKCYCLVKTYRDQATFVRKTCLAKYFGNHNPTISTVEDQTYYVAKENIRPLRKLEMEMENDEEDGKVLKNRRLKEKDEEDWGKET